MNDQSYNNWYAMSDQSLSETIGAFVKHQRIEKNWSQEKVARQANISRSTLSLLERGETVTIKTLLQVLRTLDLLHVMDVFKIHQQLSPIALAKLQQKERKRAGGHQTKDAKESD